MNQKKQAKSTIVRSLLSKVLIASIGAISLISILWISTEYLMLRSESAAMRDSLLKEHRELIKSEVDKVISYIDYRRRRVENQTKQSIRDRGLTAHAIAMNIYEEHRNDLSPAELRKMVKDALRPIRFNNGRGYYFAFNVSGIEELFADRPEMEGKNMLPMQDVDGRFVVRDMLDIAEKQGEGFYEYRWTKPNTGGEYLKFAFVKAFRPFDWVIGAGEYPDDMEHDIQKEVLEYVEQVRYRENGYIFVSRWDGVSLTEPGKGRNNIEVTDVNGIKIVRELVALAKKGGGFLEYVMPRFDETRHAPKLAYVAGIPEWRWYVGTGIYIDEIENAIAAKRASVQRRILQNICIIFIISAALVALLTLLAMRVAGKTNDNIELIADFFKEAAGSSTLIDPEGIDFSEFEAIALCANEMTKARSEAEEGLRKSEERLTLALDSVSDAVWDWRMDTGEVYFSSRWYTMLDYAPYELPQAFETWKERVHPDDLAQWEQTLFAHLESKEPFETEFRMRTKGGQWIWTLGRGRTVAVDAQGRALRMLGTLMNITERKQTEIALLNSESKWRNILVNTPQIGITLNTNAQIIFANTHFLKLTGWEEPEVLGRDWFEMFIPEHLRKEVREVFDQVMNRGGVYEFSTYENEIIDKKGELHNVAWSNVLTRDARGDVVDVTCLGVDLTERRHAEEKLKKSEARYRTMMEAIRDPVYICSEDFRIEYMNKAMAERVGRDAVGEPCFSALHDLEYACPWCPNMPEFQARHTELNIVSPMDERSYNVSSSVFTNEDGSLSKISVFRDTTEFNALQNRLQQAQKMESIGSLAGGIAHDFNNILFPIVGMAELLLQDFPPDSREHENVRQILKAGKRAGDLVKQILTFSRQSEHRMTPVSPQKILREVMKLMRSTIPSYIELEEDVQPDCGMILADPAQIHQIAMNVITNAFHAVESKGGKITVQLRETDLGDGSFADESPAPGRYALITISDTGHGIPREILHKIFDPYFTTKEQGKGTGLGLSVVYGLVKEHGGDVKVYSEEGRGSAFKIYLPLLQDAVEPVPIENVESDPVGTERILLIDDEEPIAALERQILERLGYRVTTRNNSIEALDTFRDDPDGFDLVVTDMTMPHMTGDVLAKRLHEIRPEIPVIICSGFSERIDRDKALALGFRGFLMKPILRSEIARMVRKALDDTGV